MAFRLQTNNNGIYTRDYYIIGQPIQTVGQVTQVVYSIPTSLNKGYLVNVNFSCSDANNANPAANAYAGLVKGAFRRTSGDITLVGSIIRETFTGFGGANPIMNLVANITSDTIDIQIIGRNAVTLNWIIEFTVDYRSQ